MSAQRTSRVLTALRSALRGHRAALLLLPSMLACDVFDESLLDMDGGTGPAAMDDSGTTPKPDGGGDGDEPDASRTTKEDSGTDGPDIPLTSPADTCAARDLVPELKPPFVDIDVSTAGHANDYDNAQGLQCTGGAAPGNDAFFRIDVQAEEKWHFHITPKDEGSSPVLYLLNSTCRASQCEARNGQDLCGPKLGARIGDEHFTFVAQAAGTWFLGVDDAVANPDGWNYHLFATRTSCGNGASTGGPEHGEACDPVGGLGSDPRCDSQCRNVLDPAQSAVLTEGPVNDDWTVADVLVVDPSGADKIEVLGSLGQVCAYDMYAVNVKKGVSLAVTMTLANNQACPNSQKVACDAVDAPCECDADAGVSQCDVPTEVKLDILGSDGATVLGSGSVDDAQVNACPAIAKGTSFASNLKEGVYYLRLWAPERAPRLDYKLGVELFAP